MRNITSELLELRRHYESRSATAQFQSQPTDVSELLQHVDDLLVSELARAQGLDVFPPQLEPQQSPALPSVFPTIAPNEVATSPKVKSEPIIEDEPAQEPASDRTPRTCSLPMPD